MNPIALVRRGHFPFAGSAKGKEVMLLGSVEVGKTLL